MLISPTISGSRRAALLLTYLIFCLAAQAAVAEDITVCDGLAATWMSARPGTAAAIFVPGQGPIGRNGDRADAIHATSLFLATDLMKAEMSALIFDKRGIGASTLGNGNPWDKSTMMEEASDIQCLVRWVTENKHPSRITLIGSGDGNFVAALAATTGVDAIVMLPVFEGSASELADDLRREGLAEPAVTEIEHAVATRLKGQRAKFAYSILHRPADTIFRRIRRMRPPFNRIEIVARLNVPILLIGAGRDLETSQSKFERLAASNPRAKAFFVSNMSNLLRPYTSECPESCQPARKPLGSPLEPAAVAAISSFVACGSASPDLKSCQGDPISPGPERAR